MSEHYQLHLKIYLSWFRLKTQYMPGISLFWLIQQAQEQYFHVEGGKSMH